MVLDDAEVRDDGADDETFDFAAALEGDPEPSSPSHAATDVARNATTVPVTADLETREITVLPSHSIRTCTTEVTCVTNDSV